MRFKVVVHTISASGVRGESAELSPPIELAEAQRQLTNLIAGKSARATADGWMCQSKDGKTYIVSLERCEPQQPLRAPRLNELFHQPRPY
jgi:hypothetical protein